MIDSPESARKLQKDKVLGVESGWIKKQKIDAIMKKQQIKFCCPRKLLLDVLREEKDCAIWKKELKRVDKNWPLINIKYY